MEPGIDLDAEIARKVLGLVVLMDSETGEYCLRDIANRRNISIPPYSTDTTSAYVLIQKFKAAGCTFSIRCNDDQIWIVGISHPQLKNLNFGAEGKTLPHAICQAILQFNSLFKLDK